jgi:hypothetical protein
MEQVPFCVAEHSIQSDQCWLFPLIASSELTILKCKFKKLTVIQSSPKFPHKLLVEVKITFIPNLIDEVEVPKHKPWCNGLWPEGDQLFKEQSLCNIFSRAIYCC